MSEPVKQPAFKAPPCMELLTREQLIEAINMLVDNLNTLDGYMERTLASTESLVKKYEATIESLRGLR